MSSGAQAEKRSRAWLWILIIAIFVLYCLAWRRPFCQTLEGVGNPAMVPHSDKVTAIQR
jgi:hypothetical protein